jgi:hypothetical protein
MICRNAIWTGPLPKSGISVYEFRRGPLKPPMLAAVTVVIIIIITVAEDNIRIRKLQNADLRSSQNLWNIIRIQHCKPEVDERQTSIGFGMRNASKVSSHSWSLRVYAWLILKVISNKKVAVWHGKKTGLGHDPVAGSYE